MAEVKTEIQIAFKNRIYLIKQTLSFSIKPVHGNIVINLRTAKEDC